MIEVLATAMVMGGYLAATAVMKVLNTVAEMEVLPTIVVMEVLAMT